MLSFGHLRQPSIVNVDLTLVWIYDVLSIGRSITSRLSKTTLYANKDSTRHVPPPSTLLTGTKQVSPILCGLIALLTMMTESDMVSLETPAKKDAAPTRAIAPGSIHAQ